MSVIKGWKFPIQINESNGRIQTVEDNECVKQSVKMILSTQLYERKIVPTFGTDLRRYMFEVVSPTFVSDLKKTIASSINKWEEHVLDINVSVQATPGPISTVNTSVDYITDIEPTQERVIHKVDANEQ
ncbi:MAG: GPW/gp25 family protein [Clostridia bacterium]|nr:GPW/gp25 family protein [Clostridia bacterium]